jgi:hypothetical protein
VAWDTAVSTKRKILANLDEVRTALEPVLDGHDAVEDLLRDRVFEASITGLVGDFEGLCKAVFPLLPGAEAVTGNDHQDARRFGRAQRDRLWA